MGQEVKKGTDLKNEKIDIRRFKNGLYYLKIENGITLNFIKE